MKRKQLGTYQVHGNPEDRRLTIPQDLDYEDIESELGTTFQFVIVDDEERGSYIELIPV